MSAHRPDPVTRIAGLDVLRGLAVFGILVVNVEQLFLPMMLANDPVAVHPDKPGSLLAWFITDAFFESKFLTIFSLLFGAGFCLQWTRYQEVGRPFVGLYVRRLLMLFAFGAVHALFFYYADVLVLYGLTGLVLLLFRNRSARAMIRTGAIMLGLMTVWHVLLSGPEPGGAEQNALVLENMAAIRSEAPVVLGGTHHPMPVANDTLASHLNGDIHSTDEATVQAIVWRDGPVGLAVHARAVLFAKFVTLFTPLFLLWRTLGVFLIAAGLVKLGFLDASSRKRWKRIAVVGFAFGVPMTVVASAIRMSEYEAPGVMTFVGGALHDISALLLAAAISTTVLMVCSYRIRWFGRLFASVGRLALTNYIGQSVVLSLIATSMGLGAFGSLSRFEMLLLCVPVFALQAVASQLWVRRVGMGPLERVWRWVTYGRSSRV